MRGYNIMHDPSIITTELAPVNLQAFWSQRKRWAQGWIEVALKHQMPLLRSRRLDGIQKAYWTMLLIYSAAFHFIALQVFPMFLGLTLSQLETPAVVQEYVWFTTGITLLSGPIQTLAAWSVRSRTMQQSSLDYFIYCLATPFYCVFKNVIAIIAIYDHLIGERAWVVTSRGQATQPAPAALPYAAVRDRAS
jgi:cellulose synthase/poly-beta-1,6-N-acetylglucosamine synthase-like glycosyltransferase